MLTLPDSLYVYSQADNELFMGAVLYSYAKMSWDEQNLPSEIEPNIIDYLDNEQFQWLLSLGSKHENSKIDYCREQAENYACYLAKKENPECEKLKAEKEKVFYDDELPF